MRDEIAALTPRLPWLFFLLLAAGVLANAVPAYEGSFYTLYLLGVAGAHHACALLFGTAVLTRVAPRFAARPERWWLGWALGLGALGHLYLLVGHAGLFRPAAALLVPLLGAAGALFLRRSLPSLIGDVRKSAGDDFSPYWLLSLVLVVVLSLAPPLFHDAASYHISLPQQWMLWGRIVVTDAFPHTAMPMNAELSLAPTLLATNDPRAMSAASGLAALLLTGIVVVTGKQLFSKGGLAGVVLATMPIVCFLAVGTKSDLLHAVYAAGLLYVVAQAGEEPATRDDVVMLGTFAGLAIATKTSGLALLPLVLLALIAMPRTRAFFGLRGLLVAAAVAAAVAAPVFVQNTLVFKNPLFPMLSELFGGTPEHARIAAILVAANTPVRTLGELLRLPWDLTFTARAPTMNNLPGPLPLLFAPVALLLRPLPPGLRAVLVVTLATLPGWVLTQSLLRYNPFLFVSAALLAGFVAQRLWLSARRGRLLLAAVLGSGALLSWSWTLRSHEILMRHPSEVLTGSLDEEAYLTKNYEPYAAYRFIRQQLPADAVILQMSDMRLLYLERRAILSSLYGPPPWLTALRASSSPEDALARFAATGATHLLFENNEVGRVLRAGWGPLREEERQRLVATLQLAGPPLYEDERFRLYSLSR